MTDRPPIGMSDPYDVGAGQIYKPTTQDDAEDSDPSTSDPLAWPTPLDPASLSPTDSQQITDERWDGPRLPERVERLANAPTLVAKGEPLEECGTLGSQAVCGNAPDADRVCGRPVPLLQRCHRPACPKCWYAWVERAAVRMTHALLKADLAWWLTANPGASPWDWAENVLEDDGHVQFLRFVDGQVSFQKDQGEGWVGLDRYKEARSDACDVAKDAGITGGFRVPHPYRIRDTAKAKLRGEGYGEWGENGSLWDGVREDPCEVGWRQYVEGGLHTHFIGWTGQRGTVDANVDETPEGVVLERFGANRETGDPDTVRELHRVCRYPLTHAAAPEDAPRVTNRFGDAHGAAKQRADNILKELTRGGVKGADLVDQADRAVDHVLDEILGEDSGDGEMQCPACQGRDWMSIWDARDLHAAHEDGHLELDHADELEIARALMQFGPESKVPRILAVKKGFLERDEDGELPEIDLEDPDDVHRLMGLDPPDREDEPPSSSTSTPVEPRPHSDGDSDREIPQSLDRLFNPGDYRT